MTTDNDYHSDVAFTPAVKAAQERRGSRLIYQRASARRDWPNEVSGELAVFIAAQDSFYLGTASTAGQPYIQHRGGPTGFLKVVGRRTLAFADYGGNRQYISVGNLSENNQAFIFLMDYVDRHRIKIWGTAEFVERNAPGADELFEAVRDTDSATAERVLVFHVRAWDRNCPQHINPRERAGPAPDRL